MREPARIDRILLLLEAYWKKHPDLRLGQLVCNMTPGRQDPFSFEDDALEAKLTKELGLLTALAVVSKEPQPGKETKMSSSSSSSSKPSSRSRRGKA